MNGRCPVCQERFDPGEIAALKCGHTFHLRCISQWLAKNASCPVCRRKAKPSTDVIEQLFFDYGEDSLLSCDSPMVAASVHGQLAKKVAQLEVELTTLGLEKDNLKVTREQEKLKAEKEVSQLRRRTRDLETALNILQSEKRSFEILERKNALLVTENNKLERQLTKFQSIERMLNGNVEERDDVGTKMDANSVSALRLSFGILKTNFRQLSADKENMRRRMEELVRKNSSQKVELEKLKYSWKSMKEEQRLKPGSTRKCLAKSARSESSKQPELSPPSSEVDSEEDICSVYNLRSIKTTSLAANQNLVFEDQSNSSNDPSVLGIFGRKRVKTGDCSTTAKRPDGQSSRAMRSVVIKKFEAANRKRTAAVKNNSPNGDADSSVVIID